MCNTFMRKYYLFSKDRDLPPLVITALCCQLNIRGKKKTQGNRNVQFHTYIVDKLLWDQRIQWDKQKISPAVLSGLICGVLLPLHSNLPFLLVEKPNRSPHSCFLFIILYYRYANEQLVAHVFLASIHGN